MIEIEIYNIHVLYKIHIYLFIVSEFKLDSDNYYYVHTFTLIITTLSAYH